KDLLHDCPPMSWRLTARDAWPSAIRNRPSSRGHNSRTSACNKRLTRGSIGHRRGRPGSKEKAPGQGPGLVLSSRVGRSVTRDHRAAPVEQPAQLGLDRVRVRLDRPIVEWHRQTGEVDRRRTHALELVMAIFKAGHERSAGSAPDLPVDTTTDVCAVM